MVSMKFILLLNFIIIAASNRNITYDIADNWCCKITPEIQTTSHTRQITSIVVRHGRHKCGYVSCGFLNLGRCTQWCSETWTEIQYDIETYQINRTLPCPINQLRCCPKHVYALGHCISYEEFSKHQHILAQLNDLQIVIAGPKVS